jgi:uncharacterized membrane protein (UPF0127 family)
MASLTRIFSRLFLIAVVLFGPAYNARAYASDALEKVEIDTASGPVIFDVEVMRTDAERERGLMFRAYLPERRGMLFDFSTPQIVRMWMKDTPLPLDMLFIRANGTIARITNAEPFSTRVLPSGEPVLGVLEINGGMSAKLNIQIGDRVKHTLFGPVK